MTAPRLLLPRRALLKAAAAAPLAGLAAACEPIARVNDVVSEALQQSGPAPEYPDSARTTDFPPYFISREMPQAPPQWAFAVGGLVRKPVTLSLDDLKAFPRARMTIKHHCVEGWSAVSSWTGVRVADVAQLVEPLPRARYLRFDSFDDGYANGWDLKTAFHPQTLLAYAYNDHDLAADHGAPLRVASPLKLGYKLTKYLVAMTFTDERPGGYWEDQGYPWFAGV